MSDFPTTPYRPPRIAVDAALRAAREEVERALERRSVREFAPDPVPRELIEAALRVACTAPSGANRQPWRFVAIADPELKRRIRVAAEAEEREFYARRATPEWLEALAPIGTNPEKPFLEIAPWLIVVFRVPHEVRGGQVRKNYYVTESAGIAVGMLIAALHRVGLAALTHTPAPMNFLNALCGRPASEKPFVMLPVGYPAPDCVVPDLPRKEFGEMVEWR